MLEPSVKKAIDQGSIGICTNSIHLLAAKTELFHFLSLFLPSFPRLVFSLFKRPLSPFSRFLDLCPWFCPCVARAPPSFSREILYEFCTHAKGSHIYISTAWLPMTSCSVCTVFLRPNCISQRLYGQRECGDHTYCNGRTL